MSQRPDRAVERLSARQLNQQPLLPGIDRHVHPGARCGGGTFCAACHNPIGLMGGEVDLHAMDEIKADIANNEGQQAYEARALDISLPISSLANEGVSCAVCHQSVETADEPRNGSLSFTPGTHTQPKESFRSVGSAGYPGPASPGAPARRHPGGCALWGLPQPVCAGWNATGAHLRRVVGKPISRQGRDLPGLPYATHARPGCRQ